MSIKQQPTRTVHALKTPYPEPSWPVITPQVESRILDLLVPLLKPIGRYKEEHIPKSKGRRRRKKKKTTLRPPSGLDNNGQDQAVTDQAVTETASSPPPIQRYLTVGYNSTVRHLEALSPRSRNTEQPQPHQNDQYTASPVAILVCTSVLPSVMTAPLPLLAMSASSYSSASSGNEPIRLVSISQNGASRLAEALGIPRVDVLGILPGDPSMEEVEGLIRENVEAIDIPWVCDSEKHKYRPVDIHSEEIVVSAAHANAKKRKERVN